MPQLSDSQIASLVRTHWAIDAKAVPTVVAIALAESGGDSDAVNTANKNGTTDWGLFQINDVNWRKDDPRAVRLDPPENTKRAYDVYKRQGLKAWVAYNVGAHEKFMDRARTAAASSDGAEGGTGSTGGSFWDGMREGIVSGVTGGTGGGSFTDPISGAIADFQSTLVKIMNSALLWLIAFLFLILGIIIVMRRQVGAAVSLTAPGKVAQAAKVAKVVTGS